MTSSHDSTRNRIRDFQRVKKSVKFFFDGRRLTPRWTEDLTPSRQGNACSYLCVFAPLREPNLASPARSVADRTFWGAANRRDRTSGRNAGIRSAFAPLGEPLTQWYDECLTPRRRGNACSYLCGFAFLREPLPCPTGTTNAARRDGRPHATAPGKCIFWPLRLCGFA